MHFFSSIILLSTLIIPALAQGLDQLPACAQACFGSNFGSCSQVDIKCVCSNTTLLSNISCCVANTCSAQDQETTVKFASSLCQANGVTVPTSVSCASSNATASSTTSGTVSGSATRSVTGTGVATGTVAGTAGAAPLHTAGVGVGMGLAMAGLLVAL